MESPGRRLQTAGDALQLLDRPSPLGVTPLPASDTGTGSFDRERLRQLLSSTYGPVVELLLEGWPSLVPLEQRDALGNRLLEAGLKPDDVDAALSACRQEPLAEPAVAMALTPVAASPTDSTDQAALLAGWRRAIGPVADLLLTPELAGALLRDEPSAAAALSALDLPEAVVRELMAQARQERAERKTRDPVAETAPCSEEADRQLRSALVAVVGPIGERIYADVEAVAAPMRLEAAVKALRGYSVPEDLIQELRRTHRPDPGSPAPGGGS